MKQLEDGRYTFDVACDLSGFGLGQAEDFIREQFWPDQEKHDFRQSIYWTLEVPSQDFERAFVFTYFSGAEIHLNTKYQPDEWSLTGRILDPDTKDFKMKSITVWSPGA